MSQEERNAVVSILVNLAVDIWLIVRLLDLSQAGLLAGPDGLQVWARTVLWAVPLAIGGTILGMILAAVLHGILTNGGQADTGTDERDRAYQLRGMAVTMVVASIGIVAAIIALAFGQSGVLAMTVIYFAMSAGAIAGDLVRILSYRVWG